jgi:hypothetical protein
MSSLPIGDYALLSDCRLAALVSRGGSVDWLCFPRFDGPSVSARLLDADAGHFSVRPTGDAEVTRGYVDPDDGPCDHLPDPDRGRGPDRRPGRGAATTAAMSWAPAPPGVLLRRVVCTRGRVELEVEYAPRPEYGLITPIARPRTC